MTAKTPSPAPVTAAALVADLAALGIQLEADGERLRFRPCEKVTPDLAAKLRTHKAALLAMLAPNPPSPPTPALAEGWFRVGAAAPQREHFAYDPETKTHPGWWDYLYELHNRGLAVVKGKVVKEM